MRQRGVIVSMLVLICEVDLHRARLVLGWVTVCWWVKHLETWLFKKSVPTLIQFWCTILYDMIWVAF